MTTHCQICMRVIKTVRGRHSQRRDQYDLAERIAHHGYRRPRHQGWQTASCMGAKYRPIEVACDALPVVIEHLVGYIARTEALLADFLANPPATLEYAIHPGFRWKHGNTGTVERPADFAGRDIDKDHDRYMRQTYVSLYRQRRDELAAGIKNARADLAEFERRLANWKPAEEAA